MRRCRHINRTYQLIPFVEHCMIQTNIWTGSVFRISVGGPTTIKEELPAPREALIKAGYAKSREGV